MINERNTKIKPFMSTKTDAYKKYCSKEVFAEVSVTFCRF